VSFNVHGIVYVPVSPGDSDPLEKEIRTLGELLQQVKDEQEYIKIRERVHRNSTSPLFISLFPDVANPCAIFPIPPWIYFQYTPHRWNTLGCLVWILRLSILRLSGDRRYID